MLPHGLHHAQPNRPVLWFAPGTDRLAAGFAVQTRHTNRHTTWGAIWARSGRDRMCFRQQQSGRAAFGCVALRAPVTGQRLMCDPSPRPDTAARPDAAAPLTTTATTPTPQDGAAYRRALGSFATGVTIVSGRDSQGQPRGFTANSFTSVSLDPPIVLFCVACQSASGHAFSRMGRFTINILTQDQRDMAKLFASRQVDKFRGIPWQRGTEATPRLRDPLAWFECRLARIDEIGDHYVIYGHVERFSARHETALGFHQGGWAAVQKV